MAFGLRNSARNEKKKGVYFDTLKTKEEHEHSKYWPFPKRLLTAPGTPILKIVLEVLDTLTSEKIMLEVLDTLISEKIMLEALDMLRSKMIRLEALAYQLFIIRMLLIKLLAAVLTFILVVNLKHMQSSSVQTSANIYGHCHKFLILLHLLFCVVSNMTVTIDVVQKGRTDFVPIVHLLLITDLLSVWTLPSFSDKHKPLRQDQSISEDEIDHLSEPQFSCEQHSLILKSCASSKEHTGVAISCVVHSDNDTVRNNVQTRNLRPSTSFLDGIENVRMDNIDERMSYEAIRLGSYKHFQKDFPVSLLKMAQSGFYATEKGKEVQCFSCKMSFNDWRPLDIPHKRHAIRSPECRMVLGIESKNKPMQPDTNEVLKSILQQDITVEILETYKMDARPRGIAVIINNEVFTCNEKDETAKRLDKRTGTHIDKEKLKSLWEQLHFQVELYENQTADQMLHITENISRTDHQDFDCLVYCILTHGGCGVFYGSDGREITLQSVTGFFHSSRCPTLAGKPKLFFLQACQGGLDQTGQVIRTELTDMGKPIPKDVMDEICSETIPNESDFLISYSTVPGYVSFRCPHNGTWYINSLYINIISYCSRCDLNRILTQVNHDVGKLEIRNGAAKSKQMPVFKSTLRKSLYFR